MFLITVLFLNAAKTKQELDSAVFQTAGIAQKFNCTLNRLDYMQEQGLMSSLPLANNLVPIKRALTTTSTAIFVPFTTQELFMEGDSLYYGLNAVSNNMIMADRKQLKNPNGLILGTPGSGKSFSAKREMTNVFFTTTDDIIVADPEGEYYPLVEALGGQVIHISSTSRDYINPMDINLNYADDDNPLGMKSDFILSLCELIMGARDGMEPEEKSVIRKWDGTASADIKCWGTGLPLRVKLCMFLICLCQKFFMKDREKRTQSIRRIMLRQQNL